MGALQNQVGDLPKSLVGWPSAEEVMSSIKAQEVQIQTLHADKAQVAEVFRSFQEMQQQLCTRQQEQDEHLKALVSAFREMTSRVNTPRESANDGGKASAEVDVGAVAAEALHE